MNKQITTPEQSLKTNSHKIAKLVTNQQFENYPELEIKYGKTGRDKCTEDVLLHIAYLSESISFNSKELFTDYLKWVQIMLEARHIPKQDLLNNIKFLKEACRKFLPSLAYEEVSKFLDYQPTEFINEPQPQSRLTADNPLFSHANNYLHLLLSAKRKEAMLLILDLINNNVTIEDIYEFVFQSTQEELGLLWQTNKITVAHEHYCTAATQQIMTTLYNYVFNKNKNNNKLKLLACSVSGDLHEVGIRMLSDLFEMDGWNTYFLGANMPDVNILSAIKEQKPDVFAISATMPFHLSKTKTIISKIRSDKTLNSLKIIVGGRPFNIVPGLWEKVGADGSAKNAREALSIANTLILKN